jgi:initiation factor 1A
MKPTTPMTSATTISRINVRLASHSVQILLASPSATVQQLKHHLANKFSFTSGGQLRVVRRGSLLKDSTALADGDAVSVTFPCLGGSGSTCLDFSSSLCKPEFPVHAMGNPQSADSFEPIERDCDSAFESMERDCDSAFEPIERDCDSDEEDDDCIGIQVGSMKTLRRLQSSAPKSSCKLYGNRSNLLSSDYADLVLGFVPPKLRAKAAKTSVAVKEEQAAAEFQGELAVGQHRGVVESAAGKNFRVRSLLDDRLRDCRIKGHLKRHIQINSIVVFEPSVKFCDDDHGDILWRYFEKEVERLQEKGLLPESDVLWPKISDARAIAPAARHSKPTSKAAYHDLPTCE